MPLMTMGVDAIAPEAPTPLIGNAHFTFSRETVWESIGVWVVARVFERSWLCAGQLPALAAHSGGAWPTVEEEETSPAADEPQPADAIATKDANMRMATAGTSLSRGTVRTRFVIDFMC